MKVNLFAAAFSATAGATALISLATGKTPYLGFFGRHFIAQRKWDGGLYWSMVIQYVAICVIVAIVALVLPS